jgi:amino acid adenylation domain-containing protein
VSLLDLLQECVARGIKLNASDGELQLSGSRAALTPDIVARVRSHRQELIKHLAGIADAWARPPVRIYSVRNFASYAQTRLWFANRYDGGGAHYHVGEALELVGPLNLGALDTALVEIVRRHESLRLTFHFEEAQLRTSVAEAPQHILEVAENGPSDAEAWLKAEIERPFDLAGGPMLRAGLLMLGSERHILMLTLHHVATDGWSMGILRRELERGYAAALAGETPALDPLPVQYGDYAAWQRELLLGSRLERLKDYWRAALVGAPQLHSLPLDHPRPVEVTHAGTIHRRPRCRDLSGCLRSLGRSSSATLFMVLETAFAVLLAAWSREEDIVVGTPSANRTQQEFAPLIGFFVNTLALRTQVDPAKPFRTLLAENRRRILADFEHQDLPFEMVVEELNPPRSTSHAPVFQIMFALAVDEDAKFRLGDASAARLPQPYGTAKYDLTLYITESDTETTFEWEYSTDLFEEATVSSLAESFEVLLEHVVEAPDTLVGALRLTKEADPAALVGACASEEAPAFCVHRRFEFWAASAPLAPAVVFEGETLDYGTLNARANRLARVLVERGVQRDALVGLCLERSPEMIVAVLAVLKAGGAYVPLDPAYPEARLQHMLEDSAVGLVLTDRVAAARLPASSAVTLVLDDPDFAADCNRREAEDIPPEEVDVDPESLAYVIYTSGSTGKPKGVMIEHRNVSGLMIAADRCFAFGPQDCWTLFHSYAFDFSVWEIWGALAYGGRLVVVPFDISRSPEDLLRLLVRESVTVINQTPSAFYNLAPVVIAHGKALSLRYVIFGGEALEPAKLLPWFETFGDAVPQLVNMYGITETTVHVTLKQITVAEARREASNIGRPIPNWRAVVLGPGQASRPPGCPGELFVGGAGVARGYLGRPELTESRFVPDLDRPGARLYRSGDLVRQLPGGELIYMGRIDQQVKIRGFRIELGEVEDAVNCCPEVSSSVVTVADNRTGGKFLIVHLVRSPRAGSLSEDEVLARVRAAISRKLPDFMMPAGYRFLLTLPLTPNGKVDRRRLAQAAHEPQPTQYQRPSTVLETALVAIYEQVLGVNPVGVSDNLFALGGDSIRVVQLAREVEKYGVQAEVRDFFRHQTVAELAEALATRGKANSAGQGVDTAILTRFYLASDFGPDAEDAYPVTQLQRLMLQKSSEEFGVRGVYQPQHVFRVRDDSLDAERMQIAITELVRRHPTLRTRFRRTAAGEVVQVVGKPPSVALPVTDLSDTGPDEQAARLRAAMDADLDQPFAVWDDMLLIRFRAFRLSGREWALMISSHHAVEDGWGFVEFTKALFQTYFDGKSRRTSPPASFEAPLNVFKEHVALELEAKRDPERGEVWKRLLADYRGMPPLDPVIEHNLANSEIEFEVQEHLSRRLVERARHLKAPVRTLLLIAFAKALAVQIGTLRPTIDVVSNGRSPRLSDPLGAVGLFWNFLPITVLVERSFAELLADTLRRLFEAETAGPVPAHVAAAERDGGDFTYAAFNFVQFHNQIDFADEGYPSVSTDLARDRFHHAIKLTAGLTRASDRLDLALEFDPTRVHSSSVESLRMRILDEILQLLDEPPIPQISGHLNFL